MNVEIRFNCNERKITEKLIITTIALRNSENLNPIVPFLENDSKLNPLMRLLLWSVCTHLNLAITPSFKQERIVAARVTFMKQIFLFENY